MWNSTYCWGVKPDKMVNDQKVIQKKLATLKYISDNNLNAVFEFITQSTNKLIGNPNRSDKRIHAYKLPYVKGRKRVWIYPNENLND